MKIDKNVTVVFKGPADIKKLKTLLWLSQRALAEIPGETDRMVRQSTYGIEFDRVDLNVECRELLEELNLYD